MNHAIEKNEKFAQYAQPNCLVTTSWVERNAPKAGLVVLESNEDVLLYETGHIPGALKIDWHTDLNDPISRDYLSEQAFARLCSRKGITADTTVVFYGDKSNWWAAFALWVFSLYGHKDLRLMDGGRDKWIGEGRPLVEQTPEIIPTNYPVPARNDANIRAMRDEVLARLGDPIVDVRSPGEYTGELLHMPDYPQEGASRGGHIPTARSVPWSRAVSADGAFLPRAELEAVYQEEIGLKPKEPTLVYCRIGERSAHTWFVLKNLLGFAEVKNYDGSWTEWGNLVAAPIAVGQEPGFKP